MLGELPKTGFTRMRKMSLPDKVVARDQIILENIRLLAKTWKMSPYKAPESFRTRAKIWRSSQFIGLVKHISKAFYRQRMHVALNRKKMTTGGSATRHFDEWTILREADFWPSNVVG